MTHDSKLRRLEVHQSSGTVIDHIPAQVGSELR